MAREVSSYPESYQHWGGHLPFPPDDCPCRQQSFVDSSSGIRWLDFAFCADNKCGVAPCRRRRDYTTNKEWLNEYRRSHEGK